MNAKVIQVFYRAIRLLSCAMMGLFLLASAGCFESAGDLDRSEEQHPLLKKASDRLRTRDTDGAINLYHKALESNPTLARAHLELGLIYDEHKEDYIRAVYHYKRYLEMRPTTEKKQLIQDAIRHSRMAYAASLPERPSEAIEEIAQLMNENRVLRQRNAELRGRLEEKLAAAADNPDAPPILPVPDENVIRPDPTPPAVVRADNPSSSKAYVVKNGDTLISISKKVYGTSMRWKEIYTANQSQIGTTYRLKIGQRLIIPREQSSQG